MKVFINATQIIPKLWEVKGDKEKLITLENRYPSVLTCLDLHSFRIIIKKKDAKFEFYISVRKGAKSKKYQKI